MIYYIYIGELYILGQILQMKYRLFKVKYMLKVHTVELMANGKLYLAIYHVFSLTYKVCGRLEEKYKHIRRMKTDSICHGGFDIWKKKSRNMLMPQ